MKSTVKPVVISLMRKTTPNLDKTPIKYTCLSCKKNFLNKIEFGEHVEICRGKSQVSESKATSPTRDSTNNTCAYCGKIFNTKSEFSQHCNNKIAICSFCNYKTCVKSELKLHLENDHKDHLRIFGDPSVDPFEERKRKSEEIIEISDAKVPKTENDDRKPTKLKVRPNNASQSPNATKRNRESKYVKKSKENNVMQKILKKVKLEVQDVLKHKENIPPEIRSKMLFLENVGDDFKGRPNIKEEHDSSKNEEKKIQDEASKKIEPAKIDKANVKAERPDKTAQKRDVEVAPNEKVDLTEINSFADNFRQDNTNESTTTTIASPRYDGNDVAGEDLKYILGKSPETVQSFTCKKCDKKFPSKKSYMGHVKYFNDKLKQCAFCPFKVCTKGGLNIHVKEEHPGESKTKTFNDKPVIKTESSESPKKEVGNDTNGDYSTEVKQEILEIEGSVNVPKENDKKSDETNANDTDDDIIEIGTVVHKKSSEIVIPQDLSCKRCNKKCQTASVYISHMKYQSKPLRFCRLCNFKSCTRNGLTMHYRETHPEVMIPEKMSDGNPNAKRIIDENLKCNRCDDRFPSQKKMLRHLLSKDDPLKNCPMCNFKSCSYLGLTLHCKKEHPNEYHQLRSKFICGELANKVHPNHVEQESISKPEIVFQNYKCQRCDETFTNRGKFQAHKYKYRDWPVKTCHKCPYRSCFGIYKHFKEKHFVEKVTDEKKLNLDDGITATSYSYSTEYFDNNLSEIFAKEAPTKNANEEVIDMKVIDNVQVKVVDATKNENEVSENEEAKNLSTNVEEIETGKGKTSNANDLENANLPINVIETDAKSKPISETTKVANDNKVLFAKKVPNEEMNGNKSPNQKVPTITIVSATGKNSLNTELKNLLSKNNGKPALVTAFEKPKQNSQTNDVVVLSKFDKNGLHQPLNEIPKNVPSSPLSMKWKPGFASTPECNSLNDKLKEFLGNKVSPDPRKMIKTILQDHDYSSEVKKTSNVAKVSPIQIKNPSFRVMPNKGLVVSPPGNVTVKPVVEIIPTSFEIVESSELKCDWCDVEFKNTVEKIFHQRNIKEKIPLVCGFCGFKSCTIEWLQIHYKTKHANQSKSQRINTKTKVVQEKVLESNEKNPAPVLGEPEIILPDADGKNEPMVTNVGKTMPQPKTQNLSSVQSNSTNAPSKVDLHQNSKLQCDWCDVEFKNPSEKILHRRITKRKDPLVCGFCGFKSCTIEWLRIHHQNKHSNQSRSHKNATKTEDAQEKVLESNDKNLEPVLEILLPDADVENESMSTNLQSHSMLQNVNLSSVQSNFTIAPSKVEPSPQIDFHQNELAFSDPRDVKPVFKTNINHDASKVTTKSVSNQNANSITLKCDRCDEKFSRKIDQLNHLRNIQRNCLYMCEFCFHKSCTSDGLKTHQRSLHPDKKYAKGFFINVTK